MAWRPEDRASTSAIGLSVATATFAIAFAAASMIVEEPARTDPRGAQLDLQASNALEVIIGQSGATLAGAAWVDHPDDLSRFGLALEGSPNFLDYQKIKSMRSATMASNENDAPDYADVRAALGLPDGDFHLRTYPVLPGHDDPRWTKDPRGRVAYVGHVDSARGYVTATLSTSTTAEALNASVLVRNDGSAPHIFLVSLGIGELSTGKLIATADRHTTLLAPGQTQTVWARFPPMAYSPALTGVRLDVADAYGGELIEEQWAAASAPTGAAVPWTPSVSGGKTYYRSGEEVKFIADHFEGDGTRVKKAGGADGLAAVFALRDPSGVEIVNESVTLPWNGAFTYTCPTCTSTGAYRATLWDGAVKRNATDVVYVSPTELFNGAETLVLEATREIAILQDLVENFNGETHDSDTHPEGDVFVDSAQIRSLNDHLPRYTTLVVGSEVKQNALNAAEIKWAIADWVQAGGNLVVLGTSEVQSRWLEPVYHAAQETANGGIGAPDPTHPVLMTPNKIDYERYIDQGKAWRIKEGQPFTHVLTKDAAASGDHQDVLALSEPGAYNDGTVVLTSYMVGDLTAPQDDAEAKRFLHNLLSQSYNMLFLDYGPPVPEDGPIGSAQRLVAVPHPNVPGAVVEVRIVMYTW